MSHVENDWIEVMGTDIQMKVIDSSEKSTAEMGVVVTCSLTGFYYKNEADYCDCHMPSEIQLKNAIELANDHSVDSKKDENPVSDNENTMVLIERSLSQRFQIGESDCIPALELTLRHAKLDSKFAVKCHSKFGFGPEGRSLVNSSSNSSEFVGAVPANVYLYYIVQVTQHVNSVLDATDGGNEEGVKNDEHNDYLVTLRKECGNRYFSYGEYNKAARSYSKGIEIAEKYINSIRNENSNDSNNNNINNTYNRIVEGYIACLNNLAACYINKNDFFKAKEVCISLLTVQPSNIKALLRAARASLALADYEECELCLTKVLELEADNNTAKRELMKLKAAKQLYKQQNKAMAARMTKTLFPKNNQINNSSNTSEDSLKKDSNSSSNNSNSTPASAAASTSPRDSSVGGDSNKGNNENRGSRTTNADIANSKENSSNINNNSSTDASTAVSNSSNEKKTASKTAATDQSTVSLSLFILLFTSLFIVVVSILIGYLASKK